MNAKFKPKETEMNEKIEHIENNLTPLAVAVLNYVSCGKTTIARQLLAPRLNNAKIVPIETINADDEQADALDASNFRKAMFIVDNLIANNQSVIVDIGASNIETCLAKMKTEKAFSDFDYFVLPVLFDKKTINNSVKAIDDLVKKFGVDASKIRVVFNRVDSDNTIPMSIMFAPIYKLCAIHGIPVSDFAVIHETEVFELLGKRNLINIATTVIDYRAAQRAATTDEQRALISTERVLFKMSRDMVDELDTVFDTLFVRQ